MENVTGVALKGVFLIEVAPGLRVPSRLGIASLGGHGEDFRLDDASVFAVPRGSVSVVVVNDCGVQHAVSLEPVLAGLGASAVGPVLAVLVVELV